MNEYFISITILNMPTNQEFECLDSPEEDSLLIIIGKCQNHPNIRSFIKRQTSATSSDNEWQRMTTSDNEWYNEWQRITTSDNKWVIASDSSGTMNETDTVDFKEWMITKFTAAILFT